MVIQVKIASITIMAILLFTSYEVLTNGGDILNSVAFSLNIFKSSIFPSLFPFFVLSDLLIKYGFPELIGNLTKNIMNKLFKIKSECAFIFVMSLISGNPSNAKYTKELLENKTINKYEATKILCFTCFANPLFILGTVSIIFLGNKEVGPLILFCHYIGNIIIGLLMRTYHPSPKENTKTSLKKAINLMHQKRIQNKNFGIIITEALIKSINTLLLILGVITMCLVITTIINKNINLENFIEAILNGFIEMTQGLKYISLEAIPLKLKCVLTVMILSFGGLSVHMQIMGILSDTEVKYLPFLSARICHSLISSLLTYFLFDIFF